MREDPYWVYQGEGGEMSVRHGMTLETDGHHILVVWLKTKGPWHFNVPVKSYKPLLTIFINSLIVPISFPLLYKSIKNV